MIIIWGQRMCGTTDHVGDLCHVRTRFFHLYWIPLIPVQSFILLSGSAGGNLKGVATSLSFKSVLLGWLRTALVFAVGGGFVGALINGCDFAANQETEALGLTIFCAALAVASILGYWLTVRFSHASYGRALQMAEELGLPPAYIDRYFETDIPTVETADDVRARMGD